jgi:hypothetical protein
MAYKGLMRRGSYALNIYPVDTHKASQRSINCTSDLQVELNFSVMSPIRFRDKKFTNFIFRCLSIPLDDSDTFSHKSLVGKDGY